MTRSLGLGSRLLAVALFGGAIGACKSSTPVDMYFGTDAGAAFEIPVREVHLGEVGENDADTTGGAGTTGSAGTAGNGSGGTSGTTGGAGTTGSGGDGSGGTAGTGS